MKSGEETGECKNSLTLVASVDSMSVQFWRMQIFSTSVKCQVRGGSAGQGTASVEFLRKEHSGR